MNRTDPSRRRRSRKPMAASGLALVAGVLAVVAPDFVEGQTRFSGPGAGLDARGVVAEAERPASSVEPIELSADGYERLRDVREATGLSAERLALLDADPEAAEAALRELAAWTRQQEKALDAAAERVARARGEEAAVMRRIHTGPRDPRDLAALPRLGEAAREARAAQDTLFARGAEAAAARLDPGARAQWASLRPAEAGVKGQSPSRGRGPVPSLGRQAEETLGVLEAVRGPASRLDSPAVQARREAFRAKRPAFQRLERELLPVPPELEADGSEITEAELRAIEELNAASDLAR